MAESKIKLGNVSFFRSGLSNISGSDLNDLYIPGFYTGHTLTNSPLGDTAFYIVHHFNYDNNPEYAIQLAFKLKNASNTEMYIRIKYGDNGWRNWESFKSSAITA